jgi:dTDP-4-dehydrorhamnose 3,5-epimerase
MDMHDLPLEGLKLITPKIFADSRGFFLESFHKERYADLSAHFVQDNTSFSKKGVIRGMHFQEGQAKLVSVGFGKIYDVVVDMRKDSPTFKEWFGIVLDDQKRQQLFVPSGFAHGFCALQDSLVNYKISAFYDATLERGFSFSDPEIAIVWPEASPILSERDLRARPLREVI